MAWSRREFFVRLLPQALGMGWSFSRAGATPPAPLNVDRLLSENPLPSGSVRTRKYRADAVISLLGVPIYSRQAAGSSFITLSEATEGDSSVISLQFAGASTPERVHGVNQAGYIEEVILERGSTPVEAAYFGFITSSREESFEEARQRLVAGHSGGSIRYNAAEGLHRPGEVKTSVASVLVPERDSLDRAGLIRQIRSRFCRDGLLKKELQTTTEERGPAPSTFLYAVRRAVLARAPRFECTYIHNGRQFNLRTDKNPLAHPENVVRMVGQVREQGTRSGASFKIWFEDGKIWSEDGLEPGLPLRIEYQPRPYLRITLEHDPAPESGNEHQEET